MFSFNRWSLLVGKHWVENRKRYLLSVLALMSVLLLWFIFLMLVNPINPLVRALQQITYYFALIGVGSLYASQFYSDLSIKAKAINYLVAPASLLEKLLTGILYTVVLYFIVYTLSFYVVDAIAVAIANAFHPYYNGAAQPEMLSEKAHVVNVFVRNNWAPIKVGYYGLLVFVCVQAFFLLGSVYFSQYNFIKTIIVAFVVLLMLVLLETHVLFNILPQGEGNFYDRLSDFVIPQPNSSKVILIQLPKWINPVFEILLFYVGALILWTVTYYRLKEKEV